VRFNSWGRSRLESSGEGFTFRPRFKRTYVRA
jgi:hypothetical protein